MSFSVAPSGMAYFFSELCPPCVVTSSGGMVVCYGKLPGVCPTAQGAFPAWFLCARCEEAEDRGPLIFFLAIGSIKSVSDTVP